MFQTMLTISLFALGLPLFLVLLASLAAPLGQGVRSLWGHDLGRASRVLRDKGARGLTRALAGHAMRGSRAPLGVIVARYVGARCRALAVLAVVAIKIECRIAWLDVREAMVRGFARVGARVLASLPPDVARGLLLRGARGVGAWGVVARLI